MPKRYYQLADYDNTIMRKVLENQTQNPTTGAATFAGNAAPSTAVRYAATGDDDNTLWRKILENQAHSLP